MNELEKKENLITLYPFNGQSPYLIDKFYIIGYNYLTLEKLLINETPKIILEEKEKEIKESYKGLFEIEEEPTILNEITNDYIKEGLDSKTILKMIFPNKLKCYYICEENNNMLRRTQQTKIINNDDDLNDFNKIEFNLKLAEIKKSNIIVFSSNPQTGKNSKKSINGIAYTFYSKYKKKKIINKRKYTYYIPYTFCITSEFPYFSSYYKLLKCIQNLYSQNSIYIPIEIIIYNIITLSPSPLKADLILDLNNSCNQEKIFGNINNNNTFRNKISEDINRKKSGINNSIIRKNKFNQLDEKKSRFSFKKLNTQIFNNNNNINKNKLENIDDIYKIEFDFLSGYPLIQYNLSKILFYNLSIEKIITIFLYMFLEKDVLFFSKDTEYLTLTINAYLNLSFPLNDEKYYFIGCAISLDDFIKSDSEFGLKNYTSVIGINDSYKTIYRDKNTKIDDHLVIDLEKGDIIYGEDLKDNNVNEKNKKLIKLIEKICKENNYDDKIKSITLYQAIYKLSKRLKLIYEKVYEPSIKIISGDFIDFNKDKISKINREIQESFYEFINYICLYFYENLTIRSTDDISDDNNKNEIKKENEHVMNVIFDETYINNTRYNEDELIFLEELKTTMKYESFVFGFLQSYNPIDLYKIPLTFTEEFLSIISRKKEELRSNTYNIKFFDLIDYLYLKRKSQNKNELNFMINNENYFKNIKNKFDRYILERNKKRHNHDGTNLIRLKSNNNKKTLIYQTYELDDIILLNYIHLIKNLSLSEYVDMVSSTLLIEENTLNKINITNIEAILENNCIKENILTNSDICCANILILFSISLKSLRKTMDCQEFVSILLQTFTVFRKYFSILLRMVYKLIESMKEEKMSNIGNIAMCYFPCINSIRNKKLVPNEDLMNMIIQFNKIDIKEYISDYGKKEEKKEIEENLSDIKLYGEQLQEKEINKKNLYVFHNFNSQKFLSEKDIVEYINKNDTDEIMTNTGERVYPRIRFYNGIHKIESFFMSQKVLLDVLVSEYYKYIKTLDNAKLTSKVILDACLNIFVYMRNTEEFYGMDDIFNTLKSIFYIFMNHLFILKSKTENILKNKKSHG